MNSRPGSLRSALILGFLPAFAGCVSIDPSVKHAVEATRDEAAALHASHVKDLRSLGVIVNQDEAALADAARVFRQAELAVLEARIAAAKAELMGVYDRRVLTIIGVEFPLRLQDSLYTPLDQLERKQAEALKEAEHTKAQLPDDPGAPQRVAQAQATVATTRATLAAATSRSYQALFAALATKRFEFEKTVDDAFAKIDLSSISVAPAQDPTVTAALSSFNSRIDDRLALLDQSYGAIDQTLSDLSTFLDSEVMSRRFAGHAFKGGASALVGELKDQSLFSVALTKLVGSAAPNVLKQIKDIADQLKPVAIQTADAATTAVTAASAAPAPSSPTIPNPTQG
jgi:hypothetical protein